MHHVFLVTLDKKDASTNRLAKIEAWDWLNKNLEEPFGWFVIGGRFSGYLNEKTDKYWKILEENKLTKISEFSGHPCVDSDICNKNKSQFQKLWREVCGEGVSPFLRDSSRLCGYEDDSVIMTHSLYCKFMLPLKEGAKGKSNFCIGWSECGNWIDLNGDDISEKFIDRKWLVVVDVHE